jgi:hypothetical protein
LEGGDDIDQGAAEEDAEGLAVSVALCGFEADSVGTGGGDGDGLLR